MSFVSRISSKFGIITCIGCTLHCFFEYICDFVVCSGESMQPTLYSNNILICSKIAQRKNTFERNDIVVAIHPNQPKSLICKRMIALPGDIVLMNSTKTEDSENTGSSDVQKIYIKPGSCWLEGDNRANSTDSRNYGQIPIGLIKSKVLVRVWPLSEFKFF
ncbi:CLUMA_CG005569, isoform A [Clunio marinus]|uniref:Mitochondrial inner membrane protease subunit n=1 Tax=Clunio marinus TaxID=568069 RepID=A0A1J1HVD9_9DIPT|nr:CLUMA_CG005569, isoform A [Clunio marinus]